MENGRFTIPKLAKLPVDKIYGIGPQFAQNLKSKDIRSAEDLLYVLPKTYEDRSIIHAIKDLEVGQKANIFGVIKEAYIVYFKKTKKSMFEITIDDGTGPLKATWFNFNRTYVRNVFKKGDSIFIAGVITLSSSSHLQCIHPTVEFVKESDIKKREKILPCYKDLSIFPKVHRKALFNIIDSYLDPHINDHIPSQFLPPALNMNMYDTFKNIHFPAQYTDKIMHEMERLQYSEIFYYLLGLKRKRLLLLNEKAYSFTCIHNDIRNCGYTTQEQADQGTTKSRSEAYEFVRRSDKTRSNEGMRSYGVVYNQNVMDTIIATLPFQLSADQKNVLEEIMVDLAKSYPMSRILIGDVGSGKTIVAMLAAFLLITTGYQVALLVPTQLLAHQHREYVSTYFKTIDAETIVLLGTSKNRNEIIENIKAGQAKLIIGTHALLGEDISFQNLGLVIIDEEHKFGVIQKELLVRQKVPMPHLLSMSATPIPRSTGEIVYADKDISLISKRPVEPHITTILYYDGEDSLYRMIREKIELGTQAYIVLPRIRSNEKSKNKSISEYTNYLQENYFTDFKIGLLHGEQREEENIKILEAFRKQKIDIIVATSIIEVGIHNPHANILVVIDPEYFGLIQLHQLRGRIGRGNAPGTCYLVIKEDIAAPSLERLKLLESINDGFVLSQEDYKLRGMGELAGVRQSGFPDFRFIDLKNNISLIEEAQKNVKALLLMDPTLTQEAHKGILKTLHERWTL